MPRRQTLTPYLVLFGGVLIVAAASILIRFTQGMGVPSLAIAAGRLTFAALILLPIGFVRAGAEVRRLQRRELLLGLASGLLLAIHFAAWIASLEYTSVASSVALVSTNPLWVGLASLVLLRERLAPLMLLGILLTVGGSALIGISDSSGPNSGNAMLGNGLALLGAIAGSGYFLIGRTLRPRLTVLAYIWLVYSTAAVFLLVGALAVYGSALFSYPPMAYVLLLCMAIGPQLLGHTSFNWALRYLSATFITISILGEPIGSAILAFLIFQEGFKEAQLAGFVILLAGVMLAAWSEQRQTGTAPAAAEQLQPGPEL